MINQHEGAFYDSDVEEMKKAHAKIRDFPLQGVRLYFADLCFWMLVFRIRIQITWPSSWHETWGMKQFGLKTKYYNIDLHKGAFALPNYVQDILDSVSIWQ